MKLNFLIKYYDPASLAIGATAGGIQSLLGLVQGLSADAKTKKLLSQRRAYKTPEEIYKAFNLILSQAGGDTATRDFETGQLNRDFSQVLGVSELLGGDANDFSNLFEKKFNMGLRIGNEFHKSNMEWFSKIYEGYNLIAANLAAEQKSEQDIIKDKLQAAGYNKMAGTQNFAGGINALTSVLSADAIMNLYGDTNGNTGGTDLNAGYRGGIDERDVLNRVIRNRNRNIVR